MSRIFISYRREDSSGHAGRLRDSLRAWFGAGVFQDVDGIADGEVFSEVLERVLDSCEVAVVVIGRRWLTATDEQGRRRIDNAEDWVHTETRTLLNRKIRVIPVLVDGATLPLASQLPEPLRPLAERQARELRDTAWDADVRALMVRLQEIVGSRESAPSPRKRRIVAGAVLLTVIAVVMGLFYMSFQGLDGGPDASRLGGGSGPPPAQDPRSSIDATAAGAARNRTSDGSSTLPSVLARGVPPEPVALSEKFELGFEILAKRSGSTAFLSLQENGELTSGLDEYCIIVKAESDGFLYVFQQDSSGHVGWLFPKNAFVHSSGANPVRRGDVVTIPSDLSKVLYLDDTTGTEHLFAVFSATQWSELENALALHNDAATRPIMPGTLGSDRGIGGIRRASSPVAAEVAAKVLDKVRYRLPGPTQLIEAAGHFVVVRRSFRHIGRS